MNCTSVAPFHTVNQEQTALAWSPPWAVGAYLLQCGPPWAAGRQPASPWSSPRAVGESLLWCLEHLLPLRVLFLGRFFHIFLTSLSHSCCAALFTLCVLSQRQHQCWWLAQLWAEVGLFWGWLGLTVSIMGAAPGVFLQKTHLQPPATAISPHKLNTMGDAGGG